MATPFSVQNAFEGTDRRRFLTHLSVGKAAVAAKELLPRPAVGQEDRPPVILASRMESLEVLRENPEIARQNHLVALVRLCILSMAGAGASILSGQSGKVVSSYGPINQDTTFVLLSNDAYNAATAKLVELRKDFSAFKTVARGAAFP